MSPAKSPSPKKSPAKKSMDGFSRVKSTTKAAAKSTATPAKFSTPDSKTVTRPNSSTKPVSPAQNAPTRPSEPTKKPLMANRGRFMDFAPNRFTARSSAPEREPQSDTSGGSAASTQRPTPVPRPPRSKVPRIRPVPISSGTARSNMPQMETPTRVVQRTTVVATADSMPEIAPAPPVRTRRRFARITRSGAVNLPSAPARKRKFIPSKTVASQQPLVSSNLDTFGDTPPLMSDADLAIALAGFADDPAEDESYPSLSDNLSREAASFAEEIDALDALDDLSEEILNGDLDDNSDSSDRNGPSRNDSDRSGTSVSNSVAALNIPEDLTVGDAIKEIEEAAEAAETADFVAEPKPLPLNYSPTGDRSPFLTSVRVEKRPLSGAGSTTVTMTTVSNLAAPGSKIASSAAGTAGAAAGAGGAANAPARASSTAAIRRIFSDRDSAQETSKSAESAKSDHGTIVVSTPDGKSHSIGLIIAILLTILLGAGVGAVIYLIFFQS